MLRLFLLLEAAVLEEAAELEEAPFVRIFMLRLFLLLEAAALEEGAFVLDAFEDELDALPVVDGAGVLPKKLETLVGIKLDNQLITLLLVTIIRLTSVFVNCSSN